MSLPMEEWRNVRQISPIKAIMQAATGQYSTDSRAHAANDSACGG